MVSDGEELRLGERIARVEGRLESVERSLAQHREESRQDRRDLRDAWAHQVELLKNAQDRANEAHHKLLKEALQPVIAGLDELRRGHQEIKLEQSRWRNWGLGFLAFATILLTLVPHLLPHLFDF